LHLETQVQIQIKYANSVEVAKVDQERKAGALRPRSHIAQFFEFSLYVCVRPANRMRAADALGCAVSLAIRIAAITLVHHVNCLECDGQYNTHASYNAVKCTNQAEQCSESSQSCLG